LAIVLPPSPFFGHIHPRVFTASFKPFSFLGQVGVCVGCLPPIPGDRRPVRPRFSTFCTGSPFHSSLGEDSIPNVTPSSPCVFVHDFPCFSSLSFPGNLFSTLTSLLQISKDRLFQEPSRQYLMASVANRFVVFFPSLVQLLPAFSASDC